MIAHAHTSRVVSGKPSCIWRCRCGLSLIARRGETSLVLTYRGATRKKCPHCGASLADQIGAR